MTRGELALIERATAIAERLARKLTKAADESRDEDGTPHPSLAGDANDARAILRALRSLGAERRERAS